MKALRHFGVVVSNLDKSLHFYRDLLRLKIKKEMMEEGEFIDRVLNLENTRVHTIKMAADDGNLVELLYYESRRRVPDTKKEICSIGASHAAFTVENIEQEYKKLKESGVKFNSPPQVSPDGKAKVTICYDPDGTPIELVEEIT